MNHYSIRVILFIVVAVLIVNSFHLAGAQSGVEFRELRQLGRGTVASISWKPDVSMFAVGGSKGIWLYDADSFVPFKQITSAVTTTVKWLPDGEQIAADGPDGATLYDVNTDAIVVHFPAEMRPGDWSADGQEWAFISNDGEIQICLARTQVCATRYTAQKLYIDSGDKVGGQWWLRWSPDGKRMTSDIASDLRIWNAETGDFQVSFGIEAGATAVLGWSPNGDWLLTVDHTNNVVDVWDTLTGRLAHTLEMPDLFSEAAYIAWNFDGTELAILTQSQTYLIWDAATFTLKRTFHVPNSDPSKGVGNTDMATGLEWSNRGLLGSTTASVRLWDAERGTILDSRMDYFTISYRTAWSPVDHRLATVHGYGQGRGDNRLRVWNADTGELLCMGEGHSWAIIDVAWSPDGRLIATAGGGDNSGEDSRAIVWKADTCRQLNSYDTGLVGGANSVSWSPNGNQLAIRNEVWDVVSDKRVMSLDAALKLLWNPRGKLAAAQNIDTKSITIWNLDTGKQVSTPSFDSANAMVWNRDGSLLASSGDDGAIKIWDVADSKMVQTLNGYNDQINTLAFSPDGTLIAGAGGKLPSYYGTDPSSDNTLRIWDIASGKVLAVLVGHYGAIFDIAWSADGERIASTSADGTIRIWEIRQAK